VNLSKPWYRLGAGSLRVIRNSGLTSSQAKERLDQYGYNEIREEEDLHLGTNNEQFKVC
jgi:hypothetical protein